MSLKLKALGLGLLATLAIGAVAVMNASAEPGGHFESEVEHTTIVGKESGTHRLHFTEHPKPEGAKEIGCDVASYHGTTIAKTVESITVTPTYADCYTTNTDPKVNVTVDPEGCKFTFTITKNSLEQDVHLQCPENKKLTITHPNCNITVGTQTVDDAVTYTTTTVNEKHTITLDVNATFNTTYHEKICIFLGTPQEGTLTGSVTVEGFDTEGNLVGITAT